VNILAIDSSSENLSISMLWRDELLFDFNRKIRFGSSKLIPFIDRNLRRHHVRLDDVDIFVLGSGPGSFTGLRVSFSIVKAFMIALKKPTICIESFYSMAYPFANKHNKIAVVSDARRGLVYGATFLSKDNALKKETKEKLVVLDDFVRENPQHFFITYDERLHGELLRINHKINFSRELVYPKARHYLKLASFFAKKKRFTAVDRLEPLY
jgi:tRNA threonylcarbamoyladenosine biosynthesis protein TsaB